MLVDRLNIAYYRGIITLSRHDFMRQNPIYCLDIWFGKNKRLMFVFDPHTLNLGCKIIKEE